MCKVLADSASLAFGHWGLSVGTGIVVISDKRQLAFAQHSFGGLIMNRNPVIATELCGHSFQLESQPIEAGLIKGMFHAASVSVEGVREYTFRLIPLAGTYAMRK